MFIKDQINCNSFPKRANCSREYSCWDLLRPAVIDNRILLFFLGTTGKTMGLTKTPWWCKRRHKFINWSIFLINIGWMGVSEFPSLHPIWRRFFLKKETLLRSLGIKNLSSSISWIAAIIPAAEAGGIAVEKIKERLYNSKKLMRSADPATNPPVPPKAFPNEPVMISTCSSRPKWDEVPRPFSPMTPRACASSTTVRLHVTVQHR